VLQKHIPGTAAWPQQLVVAAFAGAVLGYAYWRHHRAPGRPGGPPWLLSPLGKPAARRLARTIRTGRSGPAASGRAVLALALAGLFLYGFYRAGEQVTAGLDPNFTVNAWDGPTYLGAMACHYLDLLVVMGAAAWLLQLILPPDPADAATHSAAPSYASRASSSGYSRVRESRDVHDRSARPHQTVRSTLAVNQLSFTVRPGTVSGFLGPNGWSRKCWSWGTPARMAIIWRARATALRCRRWRSG
jgi:hypothetical protein